MEIFVTINRETPFHESPYRLVKTKVDSKSDLLTLFKNNILRYNKK